MNSSNKQVKRFEQDDLLCFINNGEDDEFTHSTCSGTGEIVSCIKICGGSGRGRTENQDAYLLMMKL